MEKITVCCNGETKEVQKGINIKKFLCLDEKEQKYCDNPVVGALANGEFKSLSFVLIHRYTIIEPIRLFSALGKRIYRHSLCFLLSYACAKLYPQHHLEIGHSLGDGFYFHFTDKTVADEDIQKLSSFMEETVKKDKIIRLEKIPYIEALEKFNTRNFRHAFQLLNSRNDGDITTYSIDDYIDLSYEPLVTNTGILSVWELQKYDKGLLLRYPQSRDFTRIHEFKDNQLLFSVFQNTEKENKVLHAEALGELNDIISRGRSSELIQMAELMFNNRIMEVAKSIKAKGSVKIIYISGPSSSGKTTFSLKLGMQLKALGFQPLKISLDDYYHPRDKVPVDNDGNKDYEALEALDLDFFRENLSELLNKGQCFLPHFSFIENKRHMAKEPAVMNEKTILLVEGIHGLNPSLAPDIDSALTFKVYISALTSMIIDDHNRISTTDNRMIRRLVRDHRTRGVKTEETLGMWPSIERGEKNYIFPYQNEADVMINSAMPYELAALAPQAINLLRSVKPDTEYAYATARRLLKFLELIYTIPMDNIPKDSITREFLGGSIFDAG